VQSSLRWSTSPDWKLDYCNIERLTPAEINRRRAEFDAAKTEAKRLRAKAGLLIQMPKMNLRDRPVRSRIAPSLNSR
jgi:hypothetical protein